MQTAIGQLFIISAPSGTGKTTLTQALLDRFSDIAYSISYTTRMPRKNEIDGVDYHFISHEEFQSGIHVARWAEWAEVHDNFYGTSAGFLDKKIRAGQSVLLDIDVEGRRQVIKRFPNACTIFILPPSLEVLEQRLRSRGTEAEETIQKRLKNAVDEISHRLEYKFIIINDDLEQAKSELFEIIQNKLQSVIVSSQA
ncbi:guanylate kinase [Desulfobacterales bacterium HSG17]|nr:guanylate kinase [Desulfobacterales bacterium HSG17]